MKQLVYLYALLGGPLRGWSRRPADPGRPFIIRCGSVWAAVEQVTAAPTLSALALRRHDAVVRRLAQDADAIAPARFGMVVADRAALVRLVAKRAEETDRMLSLVQGREQMTLRLFSSRELGGLPASDVGKGRSKSRSSAARAGDGTRPTGDGPTSRDGSGLGPGARYLRACARREATLQRELARVRATLGDIVLAERIAPQAIGPLLGSVYHLVARGNAARYASVLEDGAVARATVSGPSPCYAFADGLRL